MRGDLFVAHVDDLDALVDAAVVDVDDMAAAKRPDHLDAFVLERFGDQMPAGDHGSRRFFFRFGIYWRCHLYLAWFLLKYHLSAANPPFGAHSIERLARSIAVRQVTSMHLIIKISSLSLSPLTLVF